MSLNMMMAVERRQPPHKHTSTTIRNVDGQKTVIGIGTSRQRGNEPASQRFANVCARMFANYTLPYASSMLSLSLSPSFSYAAAAAVIPVGTLARSSQTADIIYLLLLSACKRHCRAMRTQTAQSVHTYLCIAAHRIAVRIGFRVATLRALVDAQKVKATPKMPATRCSQTCGRYYSLHRLCGTHAACQRSQRPPMGF